MKPMSLTSLAASLGLTLCLGCGAAEPVGDDPDLLGSEENAVTIAGHTCGVVLSGATGREPNRQIPVCCRPTTGEKNQINAVFNLLNQHRAANGRAALSYSTNLQRAIQGHCLHMSLHPFFSHTAPEAAISSPWTRANKCGTTANGENIAAGYATPAAVMNGWKNSSGHNANMLNSGFKRVGICRVGNNWGQIFGY
jgi:uncharacterized protein YkwD